MYMHILPKFNEPLEVPTPPKLTKNKQRMHILALKNGLFSGLRAHCGAAHHPLTRPINSARWGTSVARPRSVDDKNCETK